LSFPQGGGKVKSGKSYLTGAGLVKSFVACFVVMLFETGATVLTLVENSELFGL
jgi:hypothetical protein